MTIAYEAMPVVRCDQCGEDRPHRLIAPNIVVACAACGTERVR